MRVTEFLAFGMDVIRAIVQRLFYRTLALHE
jgi:hypothetical protein